MDKNATSMVTIVRVTDPEELPMLADIFDKALQHVDSYHEVVARCTNVTAYQNTLNTFQSGVGNPNHYIFKAVTSGGIVVGVSHWTVGYISIPKVDPFSTVTNPPSASAEDTLIAPLLEKPSPLKAAFDEARRKGWNAYISTIRGKKHVYLRRVAVLPAFQGRGIATELMKWGVDYADHEGLWCWLHARPAGLSLYKRCGWQPVVVSDFNIPGIETGPVTSMARKPHPSRKGVAMSQP